MTLEVGMSSGRTGWFDRGDRLRKAREEAGIQVQVMAELLDVHRGAINRYEHNRGVRRWVVEAYARHTGFDYDWLQYGDDGPPGRAKPLVTAQYQRKIAA